MNRNIRKNLIGRNVEVGAIKGEIIDESKNMLTIRDEKGKARKLIKKNHTFTIRFKDGKQTIDGKDILGRSEERIRLKR
jgi:RNase P/RNase MRP subunit p29